MPRKGPIPRREVLPDPIYGSRLAARFVNRLMYDGKKGAAEKIFYGALEVLAEKTGEEALRAFEKALENVKPHLEVKARRVGGATYQVPMEVRPDRQVSLSIRWLITYARSRGEQARRRASGCLQQPRRRREEKGRHPPHGRSQQGFRALPLVVGEKHVSFSTYRKNAEHRHHGSHRCR